MTWFAWTTVRCSACCARSTARTCHWRCAVLARSGRNGSPAISGLARRRPSAKRWRSAVGCAYARSKRPSSASSISFAAWKTPKRSWFSAVARTSLSNLLRANSVAVMEHRPADHPVSMPRLFGTRLLRGDSVGVLKPVPLAAPLTGAPIGPESIFGDLEPARAPAPVELAEIEEAARVQGYAAGFEEGRAAGGAEAGEAMSRSVQRLARLR